MLAFADLTPASWRRWTVPARPGAQPTLYREAPFALGALQVSPDGHRVASMSHESGRFEVYVDSYPHPTIACACRPTAAVGRSGARIGASSTISA